MHALESPAVSAPARTDALAPATLATRGAFAGGAAGLAVYAAFWLGETVRLAALPLMRSTLGGDLGPPLGALIPLLTLMAAASAMGNALGARAHRSAADAPDAGAAFLAGAGMGGLGVGLALAVAQAAGTHAFAQTLALALLPLALGLGTFGRAAFARLGGPGRARRPSPPPQLYPGLTAAGLGAVAFAVLGGLTLLTAHALGLGDWLRPVDWGCDGLVIVWSGVAASAVLSLVPAGLAGRAVARAVPEARPRTLALAGLAVFSVPGAMLAHEVLTQGLMGVFSLVALTLLGWSVGFTTVAALRALPRAPAPDALPASLSA